MANSFILMLKSCPDITEWERIPIEYLKFLLKLHMYPEVNKKNDNNNGSSLVVSYCDKYYAFNVPEEFYTEEYDKNAYFIDMVYDILEKSGLDMHMDIDDPLCFIDDDLNLQLIKLYHQVAILTLENVELNTRLEDHREALVNNMIENLQPVEDKDDENNYIAELNENNSLDPETIDFISRYSANCGNFEEFLNKYADTTATNKSTESSAVPNNIYKDPSRSTGYNKNNIINPGESKTFYSGVNNYISEPAVLRDFTPTYEDLKNRCEYLEESNKALTRLNSEYMACLDHASNVINGVYSIIKEYLNNDITDIIKEFDYTKNDTKDINENIKKEITAKENERYDLNILKPKKDLLKDEVKALPTLINPSMVPDGIVDKEYVIFTYATNPIKRGNKIHKLSIGVVQKLEDDKYTIVPLSNSIEENIVITGIYFMTPEIKFMLGINTNIE